MLVDAYGNPLVSEWKKQHEAALTEEALVKVIKAAAALIRKGVPVTALTEDSETRKLLLEYTRNAHAEHMEDAKRRDANRMMRMSNKAKAKFKRSLAKKSKIQGHSITDAWVDEADDAN